MALEVKDGHDDIRISEGRSFGAHRSVAGELVFQTGMVGYPESITDPSYRGQILVITFPLVGNYGVPNREDKDEILPSIPAHFESADIHIAGLIVSSYAGKDYSHHLAHSSLGEWLKEQGVPAVCGIDTRALTKRIRERGSMLGRLLMQTGSEQVLDIAPTGTHTPNGITPAMTPSEPNLKAVSNKLMVNGANGINGYFQRRRMKEVATYEHIDWYDPNSRNLVADGKRALSSSSRRPPNLICVNSLNVSAQDLLSKCVQCVKAFVRSSRACFVR